MSTGLQGKRVLLTQASAFMGPTLREVFAEQGADVGAREDALFAAYLCSSAADSFVGRVFPVCGGWVQR